MQATCKRSSALPRYTIKCLTVLTSHVLMIGGSLLFVFCLFMISLSQPENFYQVRVLSEDCFRTDAILSQVYLPQGLGLGIAIGTMYIPAVGVVAQYFQKRRALAIGIATSVKSLSVFFSAYSYF